MPSASPASPSALPNLPRTTFALSLLSFLPLLVACDATLHDGSARPVGRFSTPAGQLLAAYEVHGDTAVVGGDMLFPLYAVESAESADSRVLSIEGAATRWPGGVIPYATEPGFQQSSLLQYGVDAWNAISDRTGVRFVPRTTEADYLWVMNATSAGNTCASAIGRRGGPQEISVSCTPSDSIHELGHAIGLVHEMSRPDRDDHIIMQWDNLTEAQRTNFERFEGISRIRGPYDLRSIMHYPARSPSGVLLFVGRTESEELATYTTISELDIAGVAAMYAEIPAQDEGAECDASCQDLGLALGNCAINNFGDAFECMPSGCVDRVASCNQDTSSPPRSCQPAGQTQIGQCVESANTTCYGAYINSGCASANEACCFGGSWSCPGTNIVVAPNQLCDGNTDCPDGYDESDCASTPQPPEPPSKEPPSKEPPTSTWGSCSVVGTPGECIDTTVDSCTGTLHTGYCPGPSAIRCCTSS